MRFALPPLLAIALSGPPLAGCRSLLDKNDKAECVSDSECLDGGQSWFERAKSAMQKL